MKLLKISILSAIGFASCIVLADEPAKLPEPSKQQDVTYAKDIRPIFEKSCFDCHGEDKQKAELRLDTLEAALKGGKHGPDILPGKSDQSPLVLSVARVDKKTAMPPASRKNPTAPVKALSSDEVALIRAWIDQGAK
jgi:hypothetical protein